MADTDLDAVRRDAVLSSLAGFPFLLVFAVVWASAGALSYAVPADIAPWLYVCGGVPAVPAAILIERRWRYVPAPSPDPLLPLTMQILFIQVVAFPAILLVWDVAPAYVPVAFAAVVGGHFLPFAWVYRTPLYVVLGIAVSLGPCVLAVLRGQRALHETGLLVGATLLIGALAALAHARSTWSAAQAAGYAGAATQAGGR